MKSFTPSILLLLALTACSSLKVATDSKSTTQDGAPVPATSPMATAKPACLNIQDGDRHIEFDGSALDLAESGTPKSLPLASGDTVTCEKLEIVKNSREPAVLIQYRTREEGTSIGISDTKYAVASIRTGKWIMEPVTLERRFNTETGAEIEERNTLLWSEDKNGHSVLTVTDTRLRESKTYHP